MAKDTFANTLAAAEHDGDLAGFSGVLNEPGEPVDQIAEVFPVATTNDLEDVVS